MLRVAWLLAVATGVAPACKNIRHNQDSAGRRCIDYVRGPVSTRFINVPPLSLNLHAIALPDDKVGSDIVDVFGAAIPAPPLWPSDDDDDEDASEDSSDGEDHQPESKRTPR